MTPAFALTADPQRRLLTITLSGFFGAADVARLDEARRAAHQELNCAPHAHVTLVDVTACKIQPQDIVGAFSHMAGAPRYRARRLAFVTGSSLARMQVQRIAGTLSAVRCFSGREEAEAWLFEADTAAA